jgi:hypothetical protein
MVKYVLLCLLRPELVGQDVEASSCEGVSATISDERLIYGQEKKFWYN